MEKEERDRIEIKGKDRLERLRRKIATEKGRTKIRDCKGVKERENKGRNE